MSESALWRTLSDAPRRSEHFAGLLQTDLRVASGNQMASLRGSATFLCNAARAKAKPRA